MLLKKMYTDSKKINKINTFTINDSATSISITNGIDSSPISGDFLFFVVLFVFLVVCFLHFFFFLGYDDDAIASHIIFIYI